MKIYAFNQGVLRLGLPPKILLIMKLIIVLMTSCLIQVSAASFAQKLSYSKKNATLEEVFKQITLQTGYNVLYSPQKVKEATKLDVNFKNTDLKNVLDEITENQKLEYTIDSKNIIIKPKESSFIDNLIARFQAIDVRGKVVDSLGNGIAGATVSIKNGKGSTSTSANGDFYLKNVDEGSVLVVSFMGYVTMEQAAIKEFNYVILKQSTSQLDEVLVQAYGTTTRRLSTGNIAMITSKEIAQQNINNPLLALQGRVAGLEVTAANGLPGAPLKIRLRGQYARNDSNDANEPLIVIDGVPFANNIAGLGSISGGNPGVSEQMSASSLINPNEIESISILKDADATSIYGSRGSRGVILITTKKGKVGQTNVDITLNRGWQNVSKMLKLLNTEQYLEMRKEALKNGSRLSRLDNPTMYAQVYPDLLVWDQKKNSDWQEKLIGNTAEFTDLHGTVSGGTDVLLYRLGGTYHKETYVFPGDNFDQKGGANMSVTGTSPNQKFRGRLNTSYTFNKNTSAPVDFTRVAMSIAPNSPDIYGPNGELNWAPNPYSSTGASTFANPLAEMKRPFTQNVNSFITTGDINYEILPRLLFKTSFGYTKLSGKSFIINGNLASQDPSSIETPFSRFATFMNSGTESWSIEPQLTYDTKIRNGRLNILMGGALQNSSLSSDQIQAYGYSSDAVMQSLSQATGYMNIANSSSQYKYNAIFSRLNYNWEDRYLLNLSGRRDGSSRFGPGRQFGNFWSVGTGWVFTKESLFQHLSPLLSFGKVKFSYGTSGNDGIGDYMFFELYRPVADIEIYRGIKLLSSSGLFNPYFGWESVRKLEFGLDLGFFKDRLNLSGTYFRNRSSNLLGSYQLPAMAGPAENFTVNQPALIQTAGWEFVITAVNISKPRFFWNSTLNIGTLKNKELAGNDGDRTRPELGKPFYGVAGLVVFDGVNPTTGQYQFLGKDGNPTFLPDSAITNEVRTQPLFSGGLSNTFTFKNFSLDVFVQFTKQYGKNYLYQFSQTPGQAINQPVEIMDRWRAEGDNSTLQRFYAGGVNPVPGITPLESYLAVRDKSSAGWVDASFIRIKTISLSYNLTDFAKQKLNLKNLRIFAQGQNFFTWTKYKGTDPETQDPYVLPPLRTITAGIQLNL